MSSTSYKLLLFVGCILLLPARTEAAPAPDAIKVRLATVALPFLSNTSALDPAVAFSAPTSAGTVFITKTGAIVYALRPSAPTRPGWDLTETVSGAIPIVRPGPPARTTVSRFIGKNPAAWQKNIQTVQSVQLSPLLPGITVELRVTESSVEKVFTLQPGSDPARLRLRLQRVQRWQIEVDGELTIETGLGLVRGRAWIPV